MIRLLHEAYNWENEKIQTGETEFISYMTNTLTKQNRNDKHMDWTIIAHDNNNQLNKPTINKISPNDFMTFFRKIPKGRK